MQTHSAERDRIAQAFGMPEGRPRGEMMQSADLKTQEYLEEFRGVDVLTFELIKNSLSEIADEMMNTLVRTGRSVNTTQALDCSAGICDADGQLLAQALALPGHMGTFPGVMKVVLERFSNAFRPGD